MADSIVSGAVNASVTTAAQAEIINRFLTVTGTNVALTNADVVVGTSSTGENQGVLIPKGGPVTATITNGKLDLGISLPPGVGFAFSGSDNASLAETNTTLKTLVDTYIPPGSGGTKGAALHQSLFNAIDDLLNGLKSTGVTNVMIRKVDFLPATPSGNSTPLLDGVGAGSGFDTLSGGGSFDALGDARDIVFDAGTSSGHQLFAINLGNLSADTTLTLKNVESALLASAGTVRADGSTPIRIASDLAAQNIAGGSGNDTLIGGGSDTLAGGAGADLFAFSSGSLGHVTITDFSKTTDKLAFKLSGAGNLDQLKALVTGVTDKPAGITYHFGPDASITLIGVHAGDLTAGLINFTF